MPTQQLFFLLLECQNVSRSPLNLFMMSKISLIGMFLIKLMNSKI